MPNKQWQDTLDGGCEWCGTKLPAINEANSNGYVTYGLEEAHIFARKYAPIQAWNTFLLCPNCHCIFDRIVKPRLQVAVETALQGFDDPQGSGRKFVVASSHDVLLERLITKDNDEKRKPLYAVTNLPEWHERNGKT